MGNFLDHFHSYGLDCAPEGCCSTLDPFLSSYALWKRVDLHGEVDQIVGHLSANQRLHVAPFKLHPHDEQTKSVVRIIQLTLLPLGPHPPNLALKPGALKLGLSASDTYAE